MAETALAVVAEPHRKSVLVDMANRYGMEPAAFEATVRATCMRPDKNGKVPSREEFAAFLLVAKEYNLNPLTREIYAFTAKGGGIVPIVSIDGWINLINSHGACDGFEFEFEHDDEGKLVSCTCKMFRKDRSRPVVVTEWLSECVRPTEPWNMKHRMLRHKSLIQGGRYAFGFSGIYDEDEGRKIIENRNKEIQGEFSEVDDGGGPPNPANDDGGGPPAPTEEVTDVEVVEDGGGPPVPTTDEEKPGGDGLDIPAALRRTTAPEKPARSDDEQSWLDELETEFGACSTMEELSEAHRGVMLPWEGSVPTPTWNAACEIMDQHTARIQAE